MALTFLFPVLNLLPKHAKLKAGLITWAYIMQAVRTNVLFRKQECESLFAIFISVAALFSTPTVTGNCIYTSCWLQNKLNIL